MRRGTNFGCERVHMRKSISWEYFGISPSVPHRRGLSGPLRQQWAWRDDRRRQDSRHLTPKMALDRSNDHSASEPRYSGATFVANAAVPIWTDTHTGSAHNKLIIIDKHLVVGSSFNFSAAAQARNVENVTFIDSPDVASWFLANWISRRDASYRYAPTAE
jgi:phosphatidylserine/phosphatidylglycerophosphate/cardiolipin synthase-like enzyme